MNIRGDWRTRAAVCLTLLVAVSVADAETALGDDPGMAAFEAGDFERALDIWGTQARDGDPKSQFYLGYLYETGQGVEVDYEQAAIWYEKSADAGCRIADCNLGNLYMNGRGVETNHDEAVRRFGRCVSPGGICREQRVRMEEFVEEQLAWYSDQDHPGAQYELARLLQGQGAFAYATDLLQTAAENGHGLAQIALADAYLNGMGVDPDPIRGREILLRAMIDHSDDSKILASAKSAMALAIQGGFFDNARLVLDTYVWARLAQVDAPDTATLPGALFERMAVDAEQSMTDTERGEAERLVSQWKELFAKGLPSVTVEHLQTLDPPG